jgi:hypothetical protein
VRRVGDGGEHLVERERRRDGLADLVERDRLAEPEVLRREALLLQAALDDVHHLLDAEGLDHVVVGAALHRVDGGLDGAEARHDDRDDAGVGAVELVEQLEAAHAGHLQVGDDEVVGVALELLQGALPVVCGADLEALEREEVREDLPDDLLVIHHQHSGRRVEEGVLHRGGTLTARARSVNRRRSPRAVAPPTARC